jgi:hypothetical protein
MDRCEHGVYDPHNGGSSARYCTACNPVTLAAKDFTFRTVKSDVLGPVVLAIPSAEWQMTGEV